LPDTLKSTGTIAAQGEFDVSRLRILVGERTLAGAVVMGDQSLSQPLQHLVAQQADITPIRDQLLEPTTRLGDLIPRFWVEWRSQHETSQP
jgi:NAD(P)H-nitrite reductase large subunit